MLCLYSLTWVVLQVGILLLFSFKNNLTSITLFGDLLWDLVHRLVFSFCIFVSADTFFLDNKLLFTVFFSVESVWLISGLVSEILQTMFIMEREGVYSSGFPLDLGEFSTKLKPRGRSKFLELLFLEQYL